MYYHFDIISLTIFLIGSAVLVFKRKEAPFRNVGFMGLYVLTLAYLIVALALTVSWHARTGEMILRAFYEMDVLHYGISFIMPPFVLLYFIQLSSMRVKKSTIALIFIPAVLTFAAFVALNVFGTIHWAFSYDTGHYERGPLFWLSYAAWVVYFALALVVVFRNRALLGPNALLAYLLFAVFESVLQLFSLGLADFYPHGIAFSLGLLFLIIVPLLLDSGYDSLTGLMDRDGFYRAARDTISGEAAGTYQIIALNVHQFRDINTRFGREVGDTVIVRVGELLKERFPSDALIARFSADHFFVCTRNCDPALLPSSIPIRELVPSLPLVYDVFIYCGICPVEDSAEDIGLMCDRAAFAIEYVKGDISRSYSYFDTELQNRMTMQSYVVHEMRNAIANENFAIYLQPIYSVQENRVASAEALVRWVDERYGIIPPNEFIPLFEKNGFINELDGYVREQVCKLIRAWKDAGLCTCPISVNVSRTELLDPQLLEHILELLDRYGLTCDDVRIEITESAFVNPEEVIDTLERMHDSGLMILMDDFGSGYSNFNTFASMPVDVLKSDIGFVQSLDQSARGHSVLASIRDMAHQLAIPIVAEGVETSDQLELLSQLGFSYAQGYYLARPMPAADFESYLNKAS